MINKVLDAQTSGFDWLDIIDPSRTELQEVAREYRLHETSLEDCLDPRHQPKFERIEDVEFIIMRAYDDCCGHKADNVQEITRKVAIFMGRGFIITVHRRDLDFLREMRERWAERAGIKDTDITYLLFDLVKQSLLSFAPALDRLELDIDEFEKRIFSRRGTSLIVQDMYWFRSRVSAIRRVFSQSYDAFLQYDDYPRELAPIYQDTREQFDRYLSQAEALRDASSDLLNTQLSISSHQTNEVIRVLTIFSVFFLPLTFIVGIYGMNFEHMPELQSRIGYPVTWVVMVGVTIGIFAWFKKKGWL